MQDISSQCGSRPIHEKKHGPMAGGDLPDASDDEDRHIFRKRPLTSEKQNRTDRKGGRGKRRSFKI